MKKVVFFLNLTAIAIFFVLFFSTGTHADCTKDVDCKGDRVCEKGICVEPRQTNNNVQKTIRAQDGRFIAYNNGTVLDTWTNLMWAAHDNGSAISWEIAKSYCENYRGGGYTDWRMPTLNELTGLSDSSKSYRAQYNDVHLTELIKLTIGSCWSSDTRGSDALLFNFWRGTWYGFRNVSDNLGGAALPVRSVK
jgi:Protein of unknown function (DUF1566)